MQLLANTLYGCHLAFPENAHQKAKCAYIPGSVYSGTSMMQIPFVPSQVKRCPHFRDFQAWQLMHTRAIECSLLLFTVKKAICPVASTMCISGSAWRIVCKRHAIIKWILYSQGTRGTKNKCPLYGIVRCPHLGVFLSIVLLTLQSGPLQVAM